MQIFANQLRLPRTFIQAHVVIMFNPITKVNVAAVSFCKPQIWKLYISLCRNFTILQVRISISCCDKVVLMVSLGLGTKTTWLKL